MEPATKNDLKDLMKELLQELKEDIKVSVAAAFGNRKPALEQATTPAASQLLSTDAPASPTTIVDVIPVLTASAASAKPRDIDATGVLPPTPTICSTDCLNHNADGDDHMAAWQATWSAPTPFNLPQEASPTLWLRLFVALELDIKAPARCSMRVPVEDSSAETHTFTCGTLLDVGSTATSVEAVHSEPRPLPWPSFASSQEAGLRNLGNTCYLNLVLQCLTYTEPFVAYLRSGKHTSSSPDITLVGYFYKSADVTNLTLQVIVFHGQEYISTHFEQLFLSQLQGQMLRPSPWPSFLEDQHEGDETLPLSCLMFACSHGGGRQKQPWPPPHVISMMGVCGYELISMEEHLSCLQDAQLQSWSPPDQANHGSKKLRCLLCELLPVVQIWQYLLDEPLLLLWPPTNQKSFSKTVMKGISCLIYMDFINIGLTGSEATQMESYACYIMQPLARVEYFIHCHVAYEFCWETLDLVRNLWKTYHFSFYWVVFFGLLQWHNMLLGNVLSAPSLILGRSIKYRTEQQNERSYNLLAAIELAPCTMHKNVLQTVEKFRELRPTIIAENNGSNNSVIELKYGTSIWGREGCKCVIWMLHSKEELYLINWKKMTNSVVIQPMSSCSIGFANSHSIRYPVHEFSCKMSRVTNVNLVVNLEALLSGKLPWTFCLPEFQPKHPWPFSVSTISTHQLLFHMKTTTESVNIPKTYSRLFIVWVAPLLGSNSASGCHLEQLWDPGDNTWSVWHSQSLEEIASYQAILIGGRNSMDAIEIPSSGEPTPFQGGRNIMVLAFVDYHNCLGAFLNQVICYNLDDGYFLDLAQVYFGNGYHRNYSSTKERRLSWNPGGKGTASAWGQAEFQGGRSVSSLPSLESWAMGRHQRVGPNAQAM